MNLSLALGLGARSVVGGVPSLRPAGTGFRLPTTLGTRTEGQDEYVAFDFETGTYDRELSEVYFLFPLFAALIPASGGETKGTATITIRGMSVRLSDGTRVPGLINDGTDPVVLDPAVSATEYGGIIKFTPASPIPANSIVRFSCEQQISLGTYPQAGRPVGPQATSIFGGTVLDERRQSSATTLSATLSGSADYNSSGNLNACRPCAMFAELPSSIQVGVAIGDSKDSGQDTLGRNFFGTDRAAFGYLEMGFDDNTEALRGGCLNWAIPGWNHTTPDNAGTQGNANRCAGQLWLLQKVVELNGGRPIADFLINAHGTNSVAAGIDGMLAGARASNALWKAALGNADMPAYAIAEDAYPQSTNGYADVVNQTPLSAPHAFPSGARWLYTAALGWGSTTFDPEAELIADGTFDGAAAIWPISSADLADDRDLFKVRAFNTTVTSAFAGGSTGPVLMAAAPAVGDYLSFFQSGGTPSSPIYGIVTAVSGSGPFSVTLESPIAALASGASVRSTWSGGGLHPGPLAHREYALDGTYGMAGFKKQFLGLTRPNEAPAITASSITGTPEDGQILTANATATGFPVPTLAYKWQKNGANISGQTSQTITLNAGTMSLADADTISCEITATNSEGTAPAEPSVTFTAAVEVAAFLALINGVAGSGMFVESEITSTGLFTWADSNGGNSFIDFGGGFEPGISGTLGAVFSDASTHIQRTVAAGNYTLILAMRKEAGNGATTAVFLTTLDGIIAEGDDTTALNRTVLVDGSTVATRQALYNALNDGAEHTVEIRGMVATSLLNVGRNSASFLGSVRRIAVVDEDATYSDTLANVRLAGVAAVSA